MPNQSVRVQMSAETLSELNKLAIKYSCTYNKEPSISRLLGHIGDGHLTIQPNTILKNEKNSLPLLLLTITAPFNLNGVVAAISRQISVYKGNIYRITTEALDNDLGILRIFFSLDARNFSQEIKKIISLLDKLRSLKYSEIGNFNQSYRLANAYKLLVKLNKASEINGTTDDVDKYLMSKNLILDVGCTFGLRITANNRIGTIADITEIVANKQVFISEVEHTYDSDKSEDIVSLFLEIRLQRSPEKEIEEISKIGELIQRIGDVKEVDRLGLDTWD